MTVEKRGTRNKTGDRGKRGGRWKGRGRGNWKGETRGLEDVSISELSNHQLKPTLMVSVEEEAKKGIRDVSN